VVSRPEAEIDLAEASLLIAEAEYPRLDVARHIRALDELGRAARAVVELGSDRPPIERVLRFLYEEAKFSGNTDDYYDPKNSFLNDVLERRTGIPITLALVIIEVCRRAGVEAQGVSFPGHFLVRSPAQNGLFIADPFEGRLLTQTDLRSLLARHTGTPRDPDSRMLEAAAPKQILIRMLNNLRGIYTQRGERDKEREMLERLYILSPTDEVKRDLDAAGGERAVFQGNRALN